MHVNCIEFNKSFTPDQAESFYLKRVRIIAVQSKKTNLWKYQTLRESIRLAKNWKVYREIDWTTLGLKSHQKKLTHRESLYAVEESILDKFPRSIRFRLYQRMFLPILNYWDTFRFLFNALFELRKYRNSKRLLLILVEQSNSWELYHDLGLLFLSLEEYANAREAFTKSLYFKKTPNSYQGLGWSILKIENKVIRKTEINFGIYGDHSFPIYNNVYQALAYSSIGKGYNREASYAFNHSLKLKDQWESFLDLGLSYLQINQYAQAIDAFNKSISLKQDWRAIYAYGIAHHKLKINGRSDKTIKAYRKASELNQHWRIYFDLGRVLENTKQYNDAIIAYRKSLELVTDPPRSLYYHLGSVYCKTNKFIDAIEALRRCNKGIKKNDRAYRELGWALLKMKDYKAARNSFVKSILMQEHWSAYRGLGNALFELNHHSIAKFALKRSVRLELGSQGKAYCDLAWFYYKLKDYHSAIPEFKNSIQIKPNSTAYRGLGCSLLKLKKYHQAKDALQSAIELSKDWKSYRDLGWALFHLDMYEEAAHAFKKSIAINQNSSSSRGLNKVFQLRSNTEYTINPND